MAVSVSLDYNLDEIEAASVEAALGIVTNAAEEAGKFMAQRATELMGQAWDLGRPYERRRHPSTTRAADAIDYYVRLGLGDDDVEIGYEIGPEQETFLRVLGLNYGAGGGFITPSGAWELRQSPGVPKTLYWPDGNFAQEVNHTPSDGAYFLEDAMDEMEEVFRSLL